MKSEAEIIEEVHELMLKLYNDTPVRFNRGNVGPHSYKLLLSDQRDIHLCLKHADNNEPFAGHVIVTLTNELMTEENIIGVHHFLREMKIKTDENWKERERELKFYYTRFQEKPPPHLTDVIVHTDYLMSFGGFTSVTGRSKIRVHFAKFFLTSRNFEIAVEFTKLFRQLNGVKDDNI